MIDKETGAAELAALLHATWAMLIERNVLRRTDIAIIKTAANDRVRHGVDMKIEFAPEDAEPSLRGAA